MGEKKQAGERVSHGALTPMQLLAERELLGRQTSIINYRIAECSTQSVDKRVIREKRLTRPCMK